LFRKPVPVEKRFADSDLKGRQVIALRSLEKSKRITRKEYEELTGASGVTAKRDLTDLVNKQVLVRRGATRNLWYDLPGHPMTRK
jgi:Fic family protein